MTTIRIPGVTKTVAATFGIALVLAVAGATGRSAVADEPTFERDIRPILRAHCLDCHGGVEELQGGLDLRQVRLMQKGGESGTAIVPGDSHSSLMMERIRSKEMPPGEIKVTDKELETLTAWINGGAKTARPEPETIPPGLGITPEERAFWSLQPIRRSPEPAVRADQESRVRSAIDTFLLAQMPEGLSFAEDADRHTLILRAHFDLTGLPPSAELLQQWLNDPSEDWYVRLVDSLLASPNYGERWGRHWLDVAGYADSDGYTVNDAERPWAWKYRDYVIRAFNADKPFDRFITEQLAGDELAGPQQGDLTPEQIELLTATGYLRMSADGTGSGEDNSTARLCTVSRPSVRSDSSNRLLCHAGRFCTRDGLAGLAISIPATGLSLYRSGQAEGGGSRGRSWQDWRRASRQAGGVHGAGARQGTYEVRGASANQFARVLSDRSGQANSRTDGTVGQKSQREYFARCVVSIPSRGSRRSEKV